LAVLGRVLIGSSERLDLADLLSVDSFTAADFKYLLQSFVGSTTPYVLAGCEVNNPGDSIGTTSVAINIHDSVIYHPTASAGPFFYGLEEGNEYAAPLVPELRKEATNFIYLTFNTFETAQDSRAFWDPDQDGGTGSEFSQDVNTESVLSVEVGVSVATFPEGTIPICKVTMDASVITSIQDCRNMMFRLGTGGVAPNPFQDYSFRSLPSSSFQRTEPATTMGTTTSANCFQGGDKNIRTMKEWMDVVMTRIKELGGTTYWYEESTGGSSGGGAGSSTDFLKSKGAWHHSDSSPSEIEFTEDIQKVNLLDPRVIIFRACTKNLDNDEVLYADLIDEAEINAAGDGVDWTNGASYVNGAPGTFINLQKGDWIKKKTDTPDKWLRVEGFWDQAGGTGSPASPAVAISITLSGNYQGIDSAVPESSEYTQGVYNSTDLQIASRGDSALQSLTGNFFWLAARSDSIHSAASIVSTTLSNIAITEADGQRARCTLVTHGLEDGYRVTIEAGSAYAGEYEVEVEDADIFYIETTATGDETGVDAYYAMVTLEERVSSASGITLESETHNFENNQTIIISDTSYYDGSYTITIPPSSVADYTKKIQIPISAAQPTDNIGTVTLPRMNVRDEFGVTKIVQGETVDIGEGTSDAFMDYVGFDSGMVSGNVDYYTSATTTSYNTKDGMSNYNSSPSDNLTTRAAKLTAMMADRIQDRGIIFQGVTTISNNDGTTDRDIAASATLRVLKPGSASQILTLTVDELGTNECAVCTIDRNGSSGISLTKESFNKSFLLEENKFIIFYRLTTTDIYTWEGIKIPAGGTHTYGERLKPRLYSDQDRNAKLVGGGTWHWDLANTTLSWSSDAYVQIPGIADASNTIQAGNNATIADGDVLHVTLERTTGTNNLSVTDTAIASLTPDEDTYIFARRIGDEIIVGESFLLKDNEYLELDGALAEINRYHGQLKIDDGAADDQVIITAPDISMLDGEFLSQELNGFLLDIASDIVVDFNAGTISGGASGTAFTPGVDSDGVSLVSGDYVWYALGLLPDTLSALNKMSVTVQVTPGVKNSVEASTPYPVIIGSKKIGLVQVYHDGSDLEVTKIIRFGTGAGGGTGTGDANSLTETLKNQLINSWYEYVTPNIFSSSEDALVDGASTGGYSAATSTFDIDAGQTMISTQSLDQDFLADPRILQDYQLTVFWDANGVDTTADAAESFDITVVTYGSITNADYIKFFSIDDTKQYCLWFNVSGSDSAPSVTGTDEYIEVAVNGLASNDAVAGAIRTALTGMGDASNYDISIASNVVTVASKYNGSSTDASYTTGAEVTVGNFTQGRATYMISRDGGNEYQAVSMERVGSSTDTYTGSIRFRDELVKQTLHEEANTADSSVELTAAGSNQKIAQSFTVSNVESIKEVDFDVTVNGSPTGYMWVSLVEDDSAVPSTDSGSIYCESSAIDISSLSTGTLTVSLPETALPAGTYHLVIRTDASYKSAFVTGTTSIEFDSYTSSTGASQCNGSIWAAVAGGEAFLHAVKGSTLDLRVKITSGANDKMLAGYGVFYDMQSGTPTSNTKHRQVFAFKMADNENEFLITNFTPDPDLLEVYLVETGQVFKHGAFYLDGGKIVFPANSFQSGLPADLTLIAMQTQGGCVDNSDINALLLAANNLGSTDASIDRSSPGRGIYLRRPDGTLREITIDDSDNIVVYSV